MLTVSFAQQFQNRGTNLNDDNSNLELNEDWGNSYIRINFEADLGLIPPLEMRKGMQPEY